MHAHNSPWMHKHTCLILCLVCHPAIFSFRLHPPSIICNWSTFYWCSNFKTKQHVSQTSGNSVAICFASLVDVCLFQTRSDTVLLCLVPGREFPHTLVIKVHACVQTVAVSVFYQWQQCQGHAPLHYKNSMLPYPSQPWCHTRSEHTLHMGTAHTHTHNVACCFSSPSRGHRESRDTLDAAIFVVLWCCSWLKSRVCQTAARWVLAVFQNVSFDNRKPCQKFCQWQLNGPFASFSIVNCQGLESQGGGSFCSIKLYCNEVPDRKIWPQGCDQWWSSMTKWVLSPLRVGTRSQGVSESNVPVNFWLSGPAIACWLASGLC